MPLLSNSVSRRGLAICTTKTSGSVLSQVLLQPSHEETNPWISLGTVMVCGKSPFLTFLNIWVWSHVVYREVLPPASFASFLSTSGPGESVDHIWNLWQNFPRICRSVWLCHMCKFHSPLLVSPVLACSPYYLVHSFLVFFIYQIFIGEFEKKKAPGKDRVCIFITLSTVPDGEWKVQ